MSKASNFFKTTTILSTALFSLLAGCAMDNPIDYSIAEPTAITPGNANDSDTSAPTAGTLTINDGDSTTTSTSVTLEVSATDDTEVTHFYASESSSSPTANEEGWRSYPKQSCKWKFNYLTGDMYYSCVTNAADLLFTLNGSSSLGIFPRTIYIWYMDAAGNISESVSASISLVVLDNTAPTAVSVVIDNGTESTTETSVTLTLDATDDAAVTEYYASESTVTPQAGDNGWDNYSTSVSYSFDNDTAGMKTVNVWFKDAAGNVSGSVADSIERVGLSGLASRISAGYQKACVINDDDSLACWGADVGRATSGPNGQTNIKDVASGFWHTCAIKADDSAQCWGEDDDGQSSVPSGLGSVKGLAAGKYHTCAIKADDTVQCWGDSRFTSVPSGLGSVKSIDAGYYHTCAIKADDSVQCWGNNNSGESSVPSGLSSVKSISGGLANTCAITVDDSLHCWGWDYHGKNTVPSGLGSVKDVATSYYHTCAIKADDSVQCWGRNDGSSYDYGQVTVPIGLGSVKDVAAGDLHTCAIKTDDSVQCWGRSTYNALNVPAELQ